MDRVALAQMGSEELKAGMRARHRAIVSAQADLIAFIGTFNAREAWRDDGATSMAAWLVAALKIDYRSASEWVRMAGALADLPALASVFAEGKASFESVAEATKLAEPPSEQSLAEWAAADALLAAQVEVASTKELKEAVARKEAAASAGQVKRPWLRFWHDDEGFCRFTGWLPPEEGAAVITAIERASRDDDEPDPVTGAYEAFEEKAGNALVHLASSALMKDRDRARATVVVHVNLDDLISGEGHGELATGGYVSSEVARRLACDGDIECVFEDRTGGVGIGTKSRFPTDRMERYLKNRDKGCRFPGCGKKLHLNTHHIWHWTNQGPTQIANLVMLCTRHHKLVHDGKWSIRGNPEPGPGPMSTLTFLRPDGSVFEPGASREREATQAWGTSRDSASGSPRSTGSPPSGSPPSSGAPPGRGQPEVWTAPTLGAP